MCLFGCVKEIEILVNVEVLTERCFSCCGFLEGVTFGSGSCLKPIEKGLF